MASLFTVIGGVVVFIAGLCYLGTSEPDYMKRDNNYRQYDW